MWTKEFIIKFDLLASATWLFLLADLFATLPVRISDSSCADKRSERAKGSYLPKRLFLLILLAIAEQTGNSCSPRPSDRRLESCGLQVQLVVVSVRDQCSPARK